LCVFSFIDTAPTYIYPLSLHDALPIWPLLEHRVALVAQVRLEQRSQRRAVPGFECLQHALVLAHRGIPFLALEVGAEAQVLDARSEEHTSELQSRENLVCRLLLEKKKK